MPSFRKSLIGIAIAAAVSIAAVPVAIANRRRDREFGEMLFETFDGVGDPCPCCGMVSPEEPIYFSTGHR